MDVCTNNDFAFDLEILPERIVREIKEKNLIERLASQAMGMFGRLKPGQITLEIGENRIDLVDVDERLKIVTPDALITNEPVAFSLIQLTTRMLPDTTILCGIAACPGILAGTGLHPCDTGQMLSICQLFSSEPGLSRARRTIATMDALRVRHGTKQRCSRTVCALALR